MISSYLPASYKETPIYERSCFSTFMMGRVLELSTLLCKAVFEMYDVNRVLLPPSTITKVAKRQVAHVVSSLLPDEGVNRQTHKGHSRRSSELASLDGSPFSRLDPGTTPDTSLLETPTSLGSVLGFETKRYRPVPPLPVASNLYNTEFPVSHKHANPTSSTCTRRPGGSPACGNSGEFPLQKSRRSCPKSAPLWQSAPPPPSAACRIPCAGIATCSAREPERPNRTRAIRARGSHSPSAPL